MECNHKYFRKESRYWVCDNGLCYLTEEEKNAFL